MRTEDRSRVCKYVWGDDELNLPGERNVSIAAAWTLQSMHLVCCTNLIIPAIDMFDKHIYSPDTVTSQWEIAEAFCLVASWPNPSFYFLALLLSRTFHASLLIWWTDIYRFIFNGGKYCKMGNDAAWWDGCKMIFFKQMWWRFNPTWIKYCLSQPKISFCYSCWINHILVSALFLSKHLASSM